MAEVSYYVGALERLHKKCALESAHALYELQPEGYRLSQAVFDKRAFCRALARDVAGGHYRFSPARLKRVLLDGKWRTLYRFCLTDRIVHGAAWHMLADEYARHMPASLYSYIKGRSRRQALGDFARFVRRHRRQRPDPKQRGLYVLRCDVKAYGESIPVDEESLLWRQLEAAHRAAFGAAPSADEMRFLRQMMVPAIDRVEPSVRPRLGIADGSPLGPLLLNLYLLPLDHALGAIDGGFYARFGDDILLAHPGRQAFARAEHVLLQTLAQLGLKANADKYRRMYFNGAGRRDGEYKGNTRIEFLGMQVDFCGRIGLKTQKMRRLRREITALVGRAAPQLSGLTEDEQGLALCRLLNDFFSRSAGQAHPYVMALMRLADDRNQLRQLDYWLARLLIRALTGCRHARGMRRISYRTLRARWHLESLEYARNR